MSKLKIAGVIIALLGFLGIIYVVSKGSPPALPNVPDVVATVNDVELTGDEYQLRFQQMKMQYEGLITDEQISNQVLSQMVNEELLTQEAKKQGFTANDEAINEQYSQIIATFPSEEDFKNALVSEGITEDELRNNIAEQVIVDQYVDKISQERNIEISEEEIQEAYNNSIKDMEEGTSPSLDEVREQVQTQIRQEKLSEILQELVSELRASANIQIFY